VTRAVIVTGGAPGSATRSFARSGCLDEFERIDVLVKARLEPTGEN